MGMSHTSRVCQGKGTEVYWWAEQPLQKDSQAGVILKGSRIRELTRRVREPELFCWMQKLRSEEIHRIMNVMLVLDQLVRSYPQRSLKNLQRVHKQSQHFYAGIQQPNESYKQHQLDKQNFASFLLIPLPDPSLGGTISGNRIG